MTRKNADRQPWMAQLLECKPAKIAIVALANKTAHIAWAVMSRKEIYAAAAATTKPSSALPCYAREQDGVRVAE